MGGTSPHNESGQAEGAPNCFPALLSLVRVRDSGEEGGGEGGSPLPLYISPSIVSPPPPTLSSPTSRDTRLSYLRPRLFPLFIYYLCIYLFNTFLAPSPPLLLLLPLLFFLPSSPST